MNALDRQSLPVLLPLPKGPPVSGASRSTLYRAEQAGHLEFRKIGRRTFIVTESLLAWIDGLPKATIRPARPHQK